MNIYNNWKYFLGIFRTIHIQLLIFFIEMSNKTPYLGYTISMKKQIPLPNFKKLLPTKSLWDWVSLYVFYFFVTSICGFLWEVSLYFVTSHTFVNRGFLYGPWLPVYGIGGLLFYALLHKKKCQPLKVFFLSLLIGTALELLIGWQLDILWDLRYWDYRGYFLNFYGYICFFSALGFGIAGCLWVCFVSIFLKKTWFQLSRKIRLGINSLLILLFLLDCVAALIFPNSGHGITFS